MTEGQIPPCDVEAEGATLGAVLLDPVSMGRVETLLKPDHFYAEAHRRVFEACVSLRAEGQPVDLVMVLNRLNDTARLAQAGGPEYLTNLIAGAANTYNVQSYAQIVYNKWRARETIRICQSIAARAYVDHTDVDGMISEAAGAIAALPASERAVPPWQLRVRKPVTDGWFTDVPAKRKWLLCDRRRPVESSGVMLLRKTGMLAAEGGAGKTQMNVQFALAVSTGTPLFGVFDVATPGRVLMILGEEGDDDVHRRVYYAAKALHLPIPHEDMITVLALEGTPCPMLEADREGNMVETAFARWLYAWIRAEQKRGQFALTMLDPLSRFGGPEAETDNACATRFVQSIEKITTITDGASLVSHHTPHANRKGGEDKARGRGSSALIDGFRWGASLDVTRAEGMDDEERQRIGETSTLSFGKANGHRKGDELRLRFTDQGVLVPLDQSDADRIEAVCSGEAERSQKAERRERQREEQQAAREAQARAKKAAAEEARLREADAVWLQREVAMVDVLRRNPSGIDSRDLRIAMRAALNTCPHEVTDALVVRLGDAVQITTGKYPSKLHVLDESRVPDRIKTAVREVRTIDPNNLGVFR